MPFDGWYRGRYNKGTFFVVLKRKRKRVATTRNVSVDMALYTSVYADSFVRLLLLKPIYLYYSYNCLCLVDR